MNGFAVRPLASSAPRLVTFTMTYGDAVYLRHIVEDRIREETKKREDPFNTHKYANESLLRMCDHIMFIINEEMEKS